MGTNTEKSMTDTEAEQLLTGLGRRMADAATEGILSQRFTVDGCVVRGEWPEETIDLRQARA